MNRLIGIIPLVVGIFGLAYAYTLKLGELTNPGPGLWPFVIGGAITVFSIMLLVAGHEGKGYERFTWGIRTVGLGGVSLAAFILLFEWIGFILPGFLTLVFWLRFMGGESWRLTLIVSLLSTAGFYVIFAVLLGVRFPSGPIAGL